MQELGRTKVGACLRKWPAGSVLVDSMHDTFLEAFAAWPVRFFVLQPGNGDDLEIVFKAQPHEDDNLYHASDLATWLEAHA